ncbi:unnamed protein product [Brachionus calyciflorus]|uniref:SWIM-type domain-containing protein n=1 Tax=Brachionus calyciflorus TaxID=104777 RepID=A0A813XQ15_9BILA|nr:unnamed protein product [Brachionus calyciflorus]
MSNCPIEKYNAKIKDFFTNRDKFNLVPIFQILEKVVRLESRVANTQEIPLCVNIKFTYKIDSGKNENINLVKLVKKNGNEHLIYKFNDKHDVVINTNCFCPDCTNCSCFFFLDKASCLHLACCLRSANIKYPGLSVEKFVSKSTSKKRKAGSCYERD